MKKLLAGLFIAPLTMTSCFGASDESDWDLRPDEDGGFILASVGKEGVDEITFTAKDFWDHVEGTPGHYDAVFSKMDFQLSKTIYVNDVFTTKEIGEEKLKEITEDAEEEIRVQKETLENSIGSGWEEEWEKVWETAGYDDEDDFMENEIMLPVIKDAVNRMFHDWEDINVDSIVEDEEWIWSDMQETTFRNMLSATRSISMRHVLVKFDVDWSSEHPFEKADQNYSIEQTEKLNEAIDYLSNITGAEGIDWNEFAEDHSEDGSAATGGHFKFEGLDSLSSVDEFKYASYDLAAAKSGVAYNNPSSMTLDGLKFSSPSDSSTWAADLEEYTRQAQIFDVAGEKVAVTLSEFGVHIIGVDGIDDAAGYPEYIMDRAVEEKNLPNSASKPFHGDVTSAISSFANSYSHKALLEFAMDSSKNYIQFQDSGDGIEFRDNLLAHYNNQFEVGQYGWVKEYLAGKYTWIDDSINEFNPTQEPIALGKTELEDFLNDSTVWGALWADAVAGGGN